jgi:hypothetical protein
LAEQAALQGIELGHYWTDFGMGAAGTSISSLNHIFGNTDTALALKEFMMLIKREMKAQGINEVSLPEIMLGMNSWVSLQDKTRGEWEKLTVLADATESNERLTK